MDNVVEIDGKKFKLTPVSEKEEAVIDSFSTEPLNKPETPPEPTTQPELPADFPVIKAEPKVKTGLDMMIKTAKTISTARVERAVATAKEKRDYEAKIGRVVGDKRFFVGGGIEESTADDMGED